VSHLIAVVPPASVNTNDSVLLLQRADLDPSVKDHEGYTAFDLYNSTLHGTIPSPWERSPGELLTWNTNRYAWVSIPWENLMLRARRNAVISPGDPHDTAFPDSVFVGGKSNNESSTPDSTRSTIDGRFLSVGVEDVAMSRSQMGALRRPLCKSISDVPPSSHNYVREFREHSRIWYGWRRAVGVIPNFPCFLLTYDLLAPLRHRM
jgi:hypothetical protein